MEKCTITGMMIDTDDTLIMLIHTFLMYERMGSPAVFFKISNLSSRHSMEMAMAIIMGLSGGYPDLSAMCENRKLNKVVPPIIS
jgi:hypothetical protein